MYEPGILNCVANNEKGVGNDSANVYVTEVSQGFYISQPPKEIVVGDNVTVSCGVTSYKYAPNLQWQYQKDNSKSTQKYYKKDIVTSESHGYAHWSNLNFDKIGKTDSGIYSCVAEKLGDEPEKEIKTIQINVLGKNYKIDNNVYKKTFRFFD